MEWEYGTQHTTESSKNPRKAKPKKAKGADAAPVVVQYQIELDKGGEGASSHTTRGMGRGEEKGPKRYQSSSTTTAESASFRRVR